MNIDFPSPGSFLKPGLKHRVHRVCKPDLFNLVLDQELKKIALKLKIVNTVTLRHQPLLISLHGARWSSSFFLWNLREDRIPEKKSGSSTNKISRSFKSAGCCLKS